MRQDAQFDKRQVICKHATHLGYGKIRAQVGDLVLTNDGLLARMIGRITYAPTIDPTTKPIRNWILAVTMTGQMLDLHGRPERKTKNLVLRPPDGFSAVWS